MQQFIEAEADSDHNGCLSETGKFLSTFAASHSLITWINELFKNTQNHLVW